MSIADDKIQLEETVKTNQTQLESQINPEPNNLNSQLVETTNLSDTLQLIPSVNYFVNKNQPSDLVNKDQVQVETNIESYLNKLENFTKKSNKKFRIMEKEPEQLINLEPEQSNEEQPKQEEAQTEEAGSGLKKSKSLMKKTNRGNLIRQLTHESEKAASHHATDDEDDDETKKNTLANARLVNNKFTHLFFFKSDCALSSLSKQIIKSFNNFEFNDETVNGNLTTDDSDHRSRSVDKSDVSQSEPDDDDMQKSRSSMEDEQEGDSSNRPSRSRRRTRRQKTTRIIRLDMSEVDVVFDDPKTTASKIEYLDDLFKDSSINKFYAFKRTTNLSSLYLATNIAISMSSVDSDSESEGSKDIASLHFTSEKVSDIRRTSAINAQNQSILNNKNFVKLVTSKKDITEDGEEKKSIKKKIAAIKQATFDKIRSRSNSKKKRNKSENGSTNKDDPRLTHIDLRDYDDEKKKDLNDPKLDLYLESRIVSTRRNAITSRIDRYYRGAELITYMENLLRQEYIENFLL